MPTSSWKSFERRIAKAFGGKRRGPDFRSTEGGNDDVIHPTYSIECKLLKSVSWCHLKDAAEQAERNAPDGKIPLAIVKKSRAEDADSLVVLRLDTFLRFFAGGK